MSNPSLEAKDMRIGIVQARFTNEVGSKMLEVCTNRLKELGVLEQNIDIFTVPGALEIPVVMRHLALTPYKKIELYTTNPAKLGVGVEYKGAINQTAPRYHALIAIGTIIRGETYHFELVANESASGITRVALDSGIPILNAVLTTENDEQAHARIYPKATEVADGAVEMANLIFSIQHIDNKE